MNYILLIIGFFLLIKGADIFVDGASSIAKKIGIPPVIVGLTIVSIGTSAPELAVSIISAFKGSNDIAMGNVVGSNIFNTLMVLGVTSAIVPLIIVKDKIKTDFLVNVGVTVLLFFLTSDSIFGAKSDAISRFDGAILIFICIAYMAFLVMKSIKTNVEQSSEDDRNINIFAKCGMIILGAIGIVLGGQLVVNSATNIAYSFGMSEKLVGLTIVAMGTSLPELVTSVVAALKGEKDMAIGNVLGSNIFNVLLILGVSSVITPIGVSASLITDLLFLIIVNIFIFAIVFLSKGKEKKLSRIEGIIFVALYAAYMIYIISRN